MTKKRKSLKVNALRFAEYYDQQGEFDQLYQKSKSGETFKSLMPFITSNNNIILAYRNIKSNTGSDTPGTDGLTIEDIEKMNVEEVCNKVRGILKHYKPRTVRRKEIPKPNGTTRPLGIPCIWDRLIQQCILQVLEPICEAKFNDNSFGFRPLRSAENAIALTYKHIQKSKYRYAISFDVKGFFDNVNHTKLIRQIWTMNIRDKTLLCIIKEILKAPILLETREMIIPEKGTPQGGILSSLLANVVLNELDWWVSGQWENHPIVYEHNVTKQANGSEHKGLGYYYFRKTNLKDIRIVRYADDFVIFCRSYKEAQRTKHAVKDWLEKRLKLEVSMEKTKIIDLKKQYMKFLGIEIKVIPKGKKFAVKSRIIAKARKRIAETLVKEIKIIQHTSKEYDRTREIYKYNSIVRGVHNYYQMATNVCLDCDEIAKRIKKVMKSRIKELKKTGNITKTSPDIKKYGKSKQMRYLGMAWILPIGYVQHKSPMLRRYGITPYTADGRDLVHDSLSFHNRGLLKEMSKNPIYGASVEYNDNRLSLFSAQNGKCAMTGQEFLTTNEIHCHHKKPRNLGGKDEYSNLILVLDRIHEIIHMINKDVIRERLLQCHITSKQLKKINSLRECAGLETISI